MHCLSKIRNNLVSGDAIGRTCEGDRPMLHATKPSVVDSRGPRSPIPKQLRPRWFKIGPDAGLACAGHPRVGTPQQATPVLRHAVKREASQVQRYYPDRALRMLGRVDHLSFLEICEISEYWRGGISPPASVNAQPAHGVKISLKSFFCGARAQIVSETNLPRSAWDSCLPAMMPSLSPTMNGRSCHAERRWYLFDSQRPGRHSGVAKSI
jgi:hypothetical protein